VLYTGPGDVVASATAWWGLRGYNAAVSNGVTKAVNIRRASDNATQDFVILSNGNLDVASIATFISGTTGFVTKLYDQTGNGNDVAQATAANQPAFYLNGIASLPVIQGGNNPSNLWLVSAGTGFTLTQPDSVSAVVLDASAGNSGVTVAQDGTSHSPQTLGMSSPSTGKAYLYAGSVFNVTSAQQVWHAIQGLLTTGAASKIQVDSTLTTGGSVGTQTTTNTVFSLLGAYDGTSAEIGSITEAGWWASDTSASFTSLNSNQSAYWGYGNYDVSTQAWVQQVLRNGGSVSPTRQGIVDTLIKGLKSDGVWSKLDRLWLLAAENSQAALTDLVGLTLATATGSPTFTTDRGYTGTDTASPAGVRIDTGYDPSTQGVAFTQNSAHASAWCVGNVASSNGGALLGQGASNSTNTSLYDTLTDGNIYSRINDAASSGSQGAPGTRAGHWISNRSGASASQVYQNGSSFSSPNATSGTIRSGTFGILAFNDTNVGWQSGTPNQVAMASMGGSLSSTDASNFYSRLRTYMTAVGVP
jgi:hypothetical protein